MASFVDGAASALAGEALALVVDALRSGLSTYGEINDHLQLLFPEDGPELGDTRARVASDPDQRGVLEALRTALSALSLWNADTTGALVRTIGKEIGARGPALLHPIRLSLTGLEKGPDLGKVLAAVGREETLRRMDLTLDDSRV